MAEAKDRNKEKEVKSIDSVMDRKNTLTYDERVIKKIAGFAVSEIPGILTMSGNLLAGITDMLKSSDDPTKGIMIEMGKKQVAVDLKLICEYGRNIPEIFQNIVDTVTATIKEMTGLEVVEVNVHVADILTKEDFERKKKIEVAAEHDTEVLEKEEPRRVE